jgi:hypothetical protein
MRRRKAVRLSADSSACEPRTVFSSAKSRNRKANLTDFVIQALAVYDGQRCLGHTLPRAKLGVEAFDADTRSLGLYPDQKNAAAAVSRAARGAS